MTYTQTMNNIKKSLTRIKAQLDNADETKQHAATATRNAASRLERMAADLGHIEQTLKQFAPSKPKPRQTKAGPSETK